MVYCIHIVIVNVVIVILFLFHIFLEYIMRINIFHFP